MYEQSYEQSYEYVVTSPTDAVNTYTRLALGVTFQMP